MKHASIFSRQDAQTQSSSQTAAGQKADAAHISDAIDVHRDVLKTLYPIPQQRAPRSKRISVTGSVIAAALLAGVWWLDPAYKTEHFSTDVGRRSVVELADGSHLTLDTATELTVRWHLRSRQVVLADGRARFDVAPSSWRPLTVDAGQAQVRVVGTQFDVSRHQDGAQVSVYEGKVDVWRQGHEDQRVMLIRGQQTFVQADTDEVLRATDIAEDIKGMWKDGRLVFMNTPLKNAIAVIQRYRNAPIRIADDEASRLTVSGVFNSDNTDQLLELLPSILPVRVAYKSDDSIELRAR